MYVLCWYILDVSVSLPSVSLHLQPWVSCLNDEACIPQIGVPERSVILTWLHHFDVIASLRRDGNDTFALLGESHGGWTFRAGVAGEYDATVIFASLCNGAVMSPLQTYPRNFIGSDWNIRFHPAAFRVRHANHAVNHAFWSLYYGRSHAYPLPITI